MMPATLALIRVTFDDERERNLAIAVWGSLSVVGAALGPIVGGLCCRTSGGARCFSSMCQWSSWPLLARWSSRQRCCRTEALGSAVVGACAGHCLDSSWEVAHAAPSSLTFAALAVAVVGGWLFARRQARLPHPLLILRSSNPAFTAGVLAAAFAMFAIGGMQLVTTQHFQLGGFTPLQAGLLVSAVALGSLPTALLGGAFLHRLGLRVLIAGRLAAGATGALATAGLHLGLGWLLAGMVLNGAGLGAVMAVASSAIIGNVPPARHGLIGRRSFLRVRQPDRSCTAGQSVGCAVFHGNQPATWNARSCARWHYPGAGDCTRE